MCLARPGRVLQLEERDGVAEAIADFGGARARICLATLPDARVGDWILAHAGIALQRLDPEDARRTLALFDGEAAR